MNATPRLVENGAAVDLETATLDDLASLAAVEAGRVAAHLVGALGHFLRLGEVLIEARARVPNRGWGAWLNTIGIPGPTASNAMRLATYRDQLPTEAFDVWIDDRGNVQAPSINRALAFVRGLPDIRRRGAEGYPPETKAEARSLRAAGLPLGDIAALLGVSQTQVARWCDPSIANKERDKRRRWLRQRQAEQRALTEQRKRQERDALARSHKGGNLATGYALVRQALAALDRALAETSSESERQPIRDAIRHCHLAEDEVVQALRKTRSAANEPTPTG